MALRRRGGGGEALNPWPGYVDALSTLLMVIIFVLLVFVLAQAFLSVALSGRDRALAQLNRQVAELSDMLSLEKGRSAELQQSVAGLNRDLQTAAAARDSLGQQLTALRAAQERVSAERDGLKAERDRLSARLADADLQTQSVQAHAEQLQAQIADLARRGDATGQDAAATQAKLAISERQVAALQLQLSAGQTALAASRQQIDDRTRAIAEAETQLAAAQAQLAETRRQVDEMQRQRAALDTTVTADRATIEARLADIARMAEQVRNLTALREQLEKQVQDAAVRATTEQQRREAMAVELADERKFGDSAKAQIAALTRQMEQLRDQVATVSKALDLAETAAKDKDAQIANLGSRLNAALAQRVEELQRYRSDFFGKLREVLANRPGIQVVGDRFVFQSEVLFPVGTADLTPAGQDEIRQLAATLKQISAQIPADVNWLLRVDGHADRQPLDRGRFASNWELSAARAITVVKLLIAEGIPANRLAATGFGDNQPLDPADTPEAYAKNRRIEIRLTDR
jgi:chemotaxis protein MotB